MPLSLILPWKSLILCTSGSLTSLTMDNPANNGNRQRGGDFPDPTKEQDKCQEFLTNFISNNNRKYYDQLQEIANRQRTVLRIELDDVLNFNNDEDFASNIQNNTPRYVRHFEDVADKLLPPNTVDLAHGGDIFDYFQLQRLAKQQEGADPANVPTKVDTPATLVRRYEVSIVPFRASQARKLREIKSQDIGHLVKVKGMVTRASDVKPQVAVCTYNCEICGSEIFQDILGPQYMPMDKCISQRCTDNKTSGRLSMNTRGSRFVKYQELKLQELPDQVPVGHIPRSLTIHCRGEQTRQCGPGDIITVSGMFLTVKYTGYRAITAGLQADTYIEAFDVEKQKIEYTELSADSTQEATVLAIARDVDPYGKLAASIAPEIYGHDDVKKALLLQLVGGSTRVLADGMKIRGDINICLMGDPGVAKSQLLKYIATLAPRGVYTTGKGSSGVGLTAAVVRDQMTGDMALEGGALVLADMGICCIDEFDKMDESDRTAIHEVMEQQTISIAKAGITTTLNARAAVLAAANPLYGRYNTRKSISENVDLPNSLLSRFDLLFLILDRADIEKDHALAQHVQHVHKFMKNPKQTVTPVPAEAFKKYIATARMFNPRIPKDLGHYVIEAYVTLRQQDSGSGGAGPKFKQYNSTSTGYGGNSGGTDQAVMTARQLLSILRLSQALARIRLSGTVSHADIDEAIRLTHASKASLIEDTAAQGASSEDVMSAIYNVMRDYAVSRNSAVNFVQIEAMILKKGFTSQQLRSCMSEYQQLGVISVDSDGSMIHFQD